MRVNYFLSMEQVGSCGSSQGVADLMLLYPQVRARLPGYERATEVNGIHGRVLRLLALSSGHCFSADWFAEVLNYTSPKSVAPMIWQLRRKLGGPQWGDYAIRSDHGVGYFLEPSAADVDALRFRYLAEPLISRHKDVAEPDDISIDEADEQLEILEEALSLWRVNPAVGLENITADEHQYYYEYEMLYDRAQRLKILLCLRVGTQRRLRQCILFLEGKVADGHSPDWEHWCLLMRAYYSTGNPSKVKETYARAKRYYDIEHGQPVPPQIEDYFQRNIHRDEGFNLSRRRNQLIIVNNSSTGQIETLESPPLHPSRTQAGREELIRVVDSIGITTHTQLRIPGSRMDPLQLMRRARQRLWFSGVLASKWVTDPAVRNELSDFLTVLDHSPEGDVRFMIMNPDGPGYRRLRELRGDELSVEHLPILARLVREHSSFQVKVFDHLPTFRIHVIDKDVVTFSFYRLDEESYLHGDDESWQSPHVVLDPLAPWPIAEVFATLFNEMWHTSSSLDLVKYA
jgi:hypothetical protein